MTNAKHTPGPWVRDGWDILGKGKGTGQVCSVAYPNCVDDTFWEDGEADANARLIAAAPDLLEALEWIMQNRSTCNIPSQEGSWDEMAEAAIAKAKGEHNP